MLKNSDITYDFTGFFYSTFTSPLPQMPQGILEGLPSSKYSDFSKTKGISNKSDFIESLDLSDDIVNNELELFDIKFPKREKEENKIFNLLSRVVVRVDRNIGSILNNEKESLIFVDYNIFSKYIQFISNCNQDNIKDGINDALRFIHSILEFLISKMENEKLQTYIISILKDVYQLYNKGDFDNNSIFSSAYEFIINYFTIDNKNTNEDFIDELLDVLQQSKECRTVEENAQILIQFIEYFAANPKDQPMTELRVKIIKFALEQIVKLKNPPKNVFDKNFILTVVNILKHFIPQIEIDSKYDSSVPDYSFDFDNDNFDNILEKQHSELESIYSIPKEIEYNTDPLLNDLINPIINYVEKASQQDKLIPFNMFIDQFETDIDINKAILLIVYMLDTTRNENLFIFSYGFYKLINPKVFGENYSSTVRNAVLRLSMNMFYNPSSKIPESISQIITNDNFLHFLPLLTELEKNLVLNESKSSQKLVKSLVFSGLFSKLADFAITNNFIYYYLRHFIYKYPKFCFSENLIKSKMLFHSQTFIKLIDAAIKERDIYPKLKDMFYQFLQCEKKEITAATMGWFEIYSKLDSSIDLRDLMKILVQEVKKKNLYLNFVKLLTSLVLVSSQYRDQLFEIDEKTYDILVDCDVNLDLTQPLIHCSIGDVNDNSEFYDNPIVFKTAIGILIRRCKYTKTNLEVTKELIKLAKVRSNAEKILLANAYDFTLENMKNSNDKEEFKVYLRLFELLSMSQFTPSMYHKLIKTIEAKHYLFADLVFEVIYALLKDSQLPREWSFVLSGSGSELVDESVPIKQDTTIAFSISNIKVQSTYSYPLFMMQSKTTSTDIKISFQIKGNYCFMNVVYQSIKNRLKFDSVYFNPETSSNILFNFNLPEMTLNINGYQKTINILEERDEEKENQERKPVKAQEKSKSLKKQEFKDDNYIISFASFLCNPVLNCSISSILIFNEKITRFDLIPKEPLLISNTDAIVRKYSPRCVSGNKIEFIDEKDCKLTARFNGIVSFERNTIFDVLTNADYLYSLVPVVQNYCDRPDSTFLESDQHKISDGSIAVLLLKIFKVMFDSDEGLCTSFLRNDYFKYFASFLSKLKPEFVDERFLQQAVELMDTRLADKIAVAFFLNIDFAKNISRVPHFINNFAKKPFEHHKNSYFNREALVIYYGGVLEMPIQSKTSNTNELELDGRQEFLDYALELICDENFVADKSFLITYPMWNDNKGFEEAVKIDKQINIFKDVETSISTLFFPWIYMLALPDLHIFALDKFIEYFGKYSNIQSKKAELTKLSIIASLNFNSILDKQEDIKKYREIFINSSITIPLLLKILSFTNDKIEAMNWLKEQLKNDVNISQNFIESHSWQYFLLDFMFKINKLDPEPFILILQRNLSHITKLFRLIELFYINHEPSDKLWWEKFELEILRNIPKESIKGHLNEVLSVLVPLIMHDFEVVYCKNFLEFSSASLRECMDYLVKLPTAHVKTDRMKTTKDMDLLKFALDLLDFYDGKSVTIYGVKFDMILIFIDLLYEYSQFEVDIKEYVDKVIHWLSHNPMNVQLLGISNLKRFVCDCPRIDRYYNKDIEPCSYFYDRLDNDAFRNGFFDAVKYQRADLFKGFELFLNKERNKLQSKDDLLKCCMKHSYDHYYNDYMVSTKYRSEEFHNENLKDLEKYFETNGTLLFESKNDFKPTFVVSNFINRKGGRSLMEPRSHITNITHFYQNANFEFPENSDNSCIAVTIEGYYVGKYIYDQDTNYIKFNGSTKTNCHFYMDLNINEIEFIFKRICFGRDVACEIYSSFKPPLYLVFSCDSQRSKFISLVSSKYVIGNNRIPCIKGKFDLFRELREKSGKIYNKDEDFTELANKINLQSKWVNREISTFTYISYLSILGGRSYNNTMEYPFFPYIFSDYKKKELRDLTRTTCLEKDKEKNILTAKEAVFCKGCSSGLSVILDFIRCYPFYNQQYDYSGHGFDLIDRSFTTFKLVDGLECLPEFFCFPYIFVDTLGLPLYRNEKGELLHGDVILPPWSLTKENKSLTNAMKFTSLHRYYLETKTNEYIQEWFDINYGNKRGNHEYGEFNNDDSKKTGLEFENYLKYIPTDRVFKESHQKREYKQDAEDEKPEKFSNDTIIYYNKKVVITKSGMYKYMDNTSKEILQNRVIVGVCPDSNMVLYLGEKTKPQSFVILHNLENNSLSFICHQSSNITCACVCGRRLLVTGGYYGDVNIWSLPGKALIRRFSYHVSQIVKVAMSADCGLIASLDQENNLVFCTIDRKFICKMKTDAEIGLFVYKSGIVCAVGKNKITFYNSVGNILSTVELKETIIRAKKCVFYFSIDAIAVSYRVNNSDSIKVFNAAGEELEALAKTGLDMDCLFDFNKKGTVLGIASGSVLVKHKTNNTEKDSLVVTL